MLAGIVGTGRVSEQDPKKFLVVVWEIMSSYRLKPNASSKVAPNLCGTHLRMLLPQEPVEDRSSQPTDAKETVLVCIAFPISY